MIEVSEVMNWLSLIVMGWVAYVHRSLAKQRDDHNALALSLAQNHATKEDFRELRAAMDQLRIAILGRANDNLSRG